ncbi:iron complex outermembrane recepter protein/outer membrane receptor for ferrienterochelin and colicins [Flavobacterium fluvii]|uniref:Iron complex outermembrane recepter protein/outer membrane receptor for ferrienterochelin and colicins n=1 Tax=Flavobacterium fluvii TaxID=468056 RepID=A0A1M5L8E1_9FLAO|nr:TonB-dependent receptor [Flavobacterium fluvii]SHG61362.1 iron complex outermembrane recepter protein/outer membrane receptor for ferrienterochelin and colicins [Flavobacterium fluvii]
MRKTLMLLVLVTNFGLLYSQEIPKDSIPQNEEELDEVVVQSTRTSRTIKNTPTRIESIDAEELDEKANMKPSNVSMVLHESTGLQVQQTSATSGTASIRVQGLDGKYTQLLKDGYTNFGNFASGLSILEIPPLDLKQVEVIKGPSSTLFGGGSIAGVINFISKTPTEKGEHNFILNQSNIGQTNLGIYSSQRKGKWGYAILGLVNFQDSYDVDNDDFSEVPKSDNFTINPRLFYYPNETTSLMIGNSFTKGNMKGGDMHVIDGNSDTDHTYFEQNQTMRNTTTFELDKKMADASSLKLKQSLSLFDRKINIPDYQFSGFNTNAFTDVSYVWNKENQTFISGINIMYDDFNQRDIETLDAKSFTSGAYIQHTWDVTEKIKLENGLRFDNVNYSNSIFSKSQSFLLPKIAALFIIDSKWSSRIGGGLGYKIPTIFTEETEQNQYQNLLPLDNVVAERSVGGTVDVNYKTLVFQDLLVSVNQMFFLTQINKPLVLENDGTNSFFANASEPVVSQGFETNVKFVFKEDFKLFAGYTFTNAQEKYLVGNQVMPLIPKNKLNLALIYEKENNFKLGLEGYFTDKQYLNNGEQTPSYWEFGFMAEKTLWKHFSFFINFENFTDTRQSNYKRVVNGPNNNPAFDDIWMHTEGFTINGGIKIKL